VTLKTQAVLKLTLPLKTVRCKSCSYLTYRDMSGLEVVVGIAGICSAFIAASNLFNSWSSKRKLKKLERLKELRRDVRKSLSGSEPTIRGRYDEDFARLGRRFAIGDGKISLR
jgi:hypothetical protein